MQVLKPEPNAYSYQEALQCYIFRLNSVQHVLISINDQGQENKLNWDELLADKTVDQALEIFETKYNEAVKEFIPVKKIPQD